MFFESQILKVDKLSAAYGDNTVLRDVSFDLSIREILVIIGLNGSGKTTLIKSLSGTHPLKSGNIWLRNKQMKHIQPHSLIKNGVSILLQSTLVIPTLTVLENMELAILGRYRKFQKTHLDLIFDKFPTLKTMLHRKSGNLSGGERQILSLAILLLQDTNIWYLDEPTAGLSPEMVRFTSDFLKQKNEDGVAMIVVEHNLDVAINLATHIAVTKHGSLTRKFDKSEFLKKDFLNNTLYN